jgi:uncharacterized protein Smg (DUF494 family)
MKERIVEIIVFIISEMQDNKTLGDIDLVELRKKGYSQTEISAAFSWLQEAMNMNHATPISVTRTPSTSRRVFHDVEKLALSTEAQGYLIQLCELGLLESRDLESVIDRVMSSGFEKMSLLEVQEIVATILFAKVGGQHGPNRYMINNRDSIH